ncbi:type I restriction endonuclease subunit R [Arthrobacter sp. GCM10027362]|uniref:type I restriction endonuclease subunit R n=1 Tax=Arthrobacter sp. GCM10027362 TaxID=3273379 RepID=UPI00363E9747
MSAAVFNEAATVQKPIIGLLADIGWKHEPGSALPRPFEDVFIDDDLVDALIRLNPLIAHDESRVDLVLPMIKATVLSVAEDGLVAVNQKMMKWLRGEQLVRFVGESNDTAIRLIDFDSPENNSLIVSDEVTFGVPGNERRFDIVLWVNGIPLVVGETKSPVNKSWVNGAADIHEKYEVQKPQFFATNVLSFATEGKEFHYGAVRCPIDHWEMWGSTDEPYDLSGWERVKSSVKGLLNPSRLLSIITDFTLYEKTDNNGRTQLNKIIPRYPQVEAVEAIHERVLSEDSRQGLVMQNQGTGKTLAMAFAAVKLIREPALRSPTIVAVADRVDLVDQTFNQFKTTDLPRLLQADSTPDLQRALAEDKRGIIVTTIHKFADAGLLNSRDNIIVLVDEAHRTTEGMLGKQMREALPNAQFFGFTGTPIADKDRNTFKLFGDPNDDGWALNTYTPERSIADGTTVPIHVAPRLVEFSIHKELLDEAFEAFAEEQELSDDSVELIKGKLTKLSTIMSNPERVEKVCADIVEHFYSHINPLGMKAQIVAYDRPLCVAFEQEINRLLDARHQEALVRNPDYVRDEAAVVMSAGSKDDPKDWSRYDLTRQQTNALTDRFRNFHDPLKFLIVTSKLGTGFDAPIEGVLYLDKPMRLHTLFQTISRTNRKWKNPKTGQEKKYGLIVDYFGLGDEIARALKPSDPNFKGKNVNIDGLFEEFETAMETCLRQFETVNRNDGSADALQDALNCIPPGEDRDKFAEEFGMLSGIWELLYPDTRLTEHKQDYRWLASIYNIAKPSTTANLLLWKRLGAKTLQLVHDHIGDVTVTDGGIDAVIVDEETIAKLRQLGLADRPKDDDGGLDAIDVDEVIDNIATRLAKRLAGANGKHQVYKTLSERLEKLRESSLHRAKDSVDFLRKLLELAQKLVEAEKAEDSGGAEGLSLLPDPNIGALTQILEEYKPENTPVLVSEVVRDIDGIVKEVRYDGWSQTREGDRAVRKEIRLVLKKYLLDTSGPLFDKTYAYVAENY